MSGGRTRSRGSRKPTVTERFAREREQGRQHAGDRLADDRDELLRDQARARAAEHAPARIKPKPAQTPPKPLTELELAEAAEQARTRRTVWLREPVPMPGTSRRCFAYDPEAIPTWLQEVLDAAV